MNKAIAKYILPVLFTLILPPLLSGCVSQRFENNQPIVKTQANRDEMAATRVSLGLGYLKIGDMSQAKLNLEKAKRFSPQLVQVHTAFAHYYETVGEGLLAIESFEEALLLQPDSADTLNNYGVFLCRQGQVEEAEVQFLKAIAVPSYLLVSQSYENLSSCYLQIDNFEKSEMYLNKAIFHDPNRTKTLLQMVRLQYALGKYKESKQYLQKFERNTQRFTADSLSLSYKLYRKLGQRRTATNYANMLIKMYPQSWEGKQYLLNGLSFITADQLAKRYQLTQKHNNRQVLPTSNKRVVKLSPRKSNNTPYTGSIKTIVPRVKESVTAVIQVKNTVTTADKKLNVALTPLTNATQSSFGPDTLLLPTAVIATESEVTVFNTEEIKATTEEIQATTEEIKATKIQSIEKVPAVIIDTPVVTHAAFTLPVVGESTSTAPIPATRDVALPEAIVEVVEADVFVVSTQPQDSLTTVEPSETILEEIINVESVDTTENVHKVSEGQSLYIISVKYNVKMKSLLKWNNLSEKSKLRIGDKLYVVDPQTVKIIND